MVLQREKSNEKKGKGQATFQKESETKEWCKSSRGQCYTYMIRNVESNSAGNIRASLKTVPCAFEERIYKLLCFDNQCILPYSFVEPIFGI